MASTMKARYWKNWTYPLDITVDELLNNKDYLRDRSALFMKHRNGWWWYHGAKQIRDLNVSGHDTFMRNIVCDYDE